MNKKKHLNLAGVLFLSAVLIFSTTMATANTLTSQPTKNSNESIPRTQKITSNPKTQTRTDLLNEGFEGTTFPPTGWTRIQTNTGVCDDFPQYNAYWWRYVGSAHTGTSCAAVWWDYQHQDEWLITPNLDLSGYTSAQLTFWFYGYLGSTHDDHYYVQVSTDGGSTWTVLLDLSSMSGGWNYWASPLTVNLTAYLGQNIQLAFHALDPPTNDGLWYQWEIDDVVVSGEGGNTDVTPPITTCSLNGAMQGNVYITDVTATLSATDAGSGVNYTMYQVDNGVWNTYTMPFVVTGNGDHTINFYSVDVAGNQETEKTTTFTIQYPIIITIKGGLGVSATIKNNGTVAFTNLSWSINLNGGFILLGKTKTGTIASLAAGETATVKDMVFGFGKATIIVTAGDTEKGATGTVLLFFVIGVA